MFWGASHLNCVYIFRKVTFVEKLEVLLNGVSWRFHTAALAPTLERICISASACSCILHAKWAYSQLSQSLAASLNPCELFSLPLNSYINISLKTFCFCSVLYSWLHIYTTGESSKMRAFNMNNIVLFGLHYWQKYLIILMACLGRTWLVFPASLQIQFLDV